MSSEHKVSQKKQIISFRTKKNSHMKKKNSLNKTKKKNVYDLKILICQTCDQKAVVIY